MWKNIKKEIRKNKFEYGVVFVILVLAFFMRVYRLDQLLGFYFDQGRDALVIWDLWHKGKLFLIGPVTGLAGIFLGPFFYYLIAPFYLIGGGNPVYPAIFLAFTSTLALFFLYLLGKKMQSRMTGFIALVIGSFSYYLVLAGRWLSNPTAIMLTSILLLWMMWEISEGNRLKVKGKWQDMDLHWLAVAFLAGISLQFEAASAVFFIPMIFAFTIYLYFSQKENFPGTKTVIFGILILLATLLPQILFNLRHDNILFDNFQRFFGEEQQVGTPLTSYNLNRKKEFFINAFESKIFPGVAPSKNIFYASSLLGILLLIRKKRKDLALFAIFLGIPTVGYVIYQSNHGNIFDYYTTGYYLSMILLFSMGLGRLWKNIIGKFIVVSFLFIFLNVNLPTIKNYISAGVDGPTHITLGNQMQAVGWVFEDARGRGEFNVDIYVPPVIPHAYDYLFLWQANKRCGGDLCGMAEDRKELLYILYEVDPPHPERLETWLSKYEENTVIEEEVQYGGIYVQRRMRL
jgi:4-amino-4-deoxy-L-arabinose transferase-like glycosyltransferase